MTLKAPPIRRDPDIRVGLDVARPHCLGDAVLEDLLTSAEVTFSGPDAQAAQTEYDRLVFMLLLCDHVTPQHLPRLAEAALAEAGRDKPARWPVETPVCLSVHDRRVLQWPCTIAFRLLRVVGGEYVAPPEALDKVNKARKVRGKPPVPTEGLRNRLRHGEIPGAYRPGDTVWLIPWTRRSFDAIREKPRGRPRKSTQEGDPR